MFMSKYGREKKRNGGVDGCKIKDGVLRHTNLNTSRTIVVVNIGIERCQSQVNSMIWLV